MHTQTHTHASAAVATTTTKYACISHHCSRRTPHTDTFLKFIHTYIMPCPHLGVILVHVKVVGITAQERRPAAVGLLRGPLDMVEIEA